MKDYQENILKLPEVRYCCTCQSEIKQSNGGTLIRDLIKFMENGIQPDYVRELCGICTLTINPEEIE